jgi:hypothetical protein
MPRNQAHPVDPAVPPMVISATISVVIYAMFALFQGF